MEDKTTRELLEMLREAQGQDNELASEISQKLRIRIPDGGIYALIPNAVYLNGWLYALLTWEDLEN